MQLNQEAWACKKAHKCKPRFEFDISRSLRNSRHKGEYKERWRAITTKKHNQGFRFDNTYWLSKEWFWVSKLLPFLLFAIEPLYRECLVLSHWIAGTKCQPLIAFYSSLSPSKGISPASQKGLIPLLNAPLPSSFLALKSFAFFVSHCSYSVSLLAWPSFVLFLFNICCSFASFSPGFSVFLALFSLRKKN